MGTGEHGGFGYTSGSSKSKIFTRVQYEGTVTVGGEVRDVSRRVYQRNDIDFDYYDSKTKRTNLQRMMDGDAPIGNDGKPIQLHHVLQKESGPMAEVREVTHREYKRTLHGLVSSGNSFRNNPDLKKQYNNFRRAYWIWRAKQYLEGR
ncbi:MAG: HNH/ENDO VII family nuclease [Eggerthellaceae bacterium]|nr:HNH/ENDO VII family nuclease [Eggerthellaceae bacterium]